MILVTLLTVGLGYLAMQYTHLSGFLIWPGATAIVVIVGFNLLNVDRLVLGVRVRGERAAGRLSVVIWMALLAEAIYTSYWLIERLFHWISLQEYT